jgi:hypothetical protein
MSYLFTAKLRGGSPQPDRIGLGDGLSPPTIGGGGQYTMVVQPELLGSTPGAVAGSVSIPTVVIRTGQQFDLAALTGLGEGDAPPPQVLVFLEDDAGG